MKSLQNNSRKTEKCLMCNSRRTLSKLRISPKETVPICPVCRDMIMFSSQLKR